MLFDFLAAENGTVAAGAQKPAETDRRRGDIQQRRRRRRAMLAPWSDACRRGSPGRRTTKSKCNPSKSGPYVRDLTAVGDPRVDGK